MPTPAAGGAASNGHAGAGWIEAVVARLESPLTVYVRRLIGPDRAADVVQDAFVQLCRQERATVEPLLPAWLYQVCRHRAVDILRKDGRMQLVETTVLTDQPTQAPDPATRAEVNDDLQQLAGRLAHLPESQQEVIRLKFQHALSYQQIADVTGLTVSHVGVLLHQAIKTLRQQMT